MPNRTLPLTYAGWSYFDSTRALERGDICPDNIDLTYVAVDDTSELFRQMVGGAPFDAAEMSLSTFIALRSRGDERLTGIPIFPSRSFRHGQIYVHVGSGIEEPGDLRGKRVGVPHYEMTSALWIRGFLQHDYGVRPEDVDWWTGGLTSPYFRPRSPHRFPGVTIRRIPEQRSLEDMLDTGELDALVSAQVPACWGRGPIRRLFGDYRAAELRYLCRTRIFPIMHLVVIQCELYRREPWVALALTNAFERSRQDARQRIARRDVIPVMYPWFAEEVEALEQLVGGDPFANGVSPNRTALDAAVALSFEQRLSPRQIEVDELFAPETLDWCSAPAVLVRDAR